MIIIYKQYKECYSLANYAFIYSLAGNIEKHFSFIKEVGMSCREFYSNNVLEIKMNYNKPIAYISVGKSVNLEKEINLERLSFDYIYIDGIKLVGSNTHLISVDPPNTQDYILACDYIITKAGWSTIAEGICAQKPMLVIKRDEVSEDRTTIEKLSELNIAIPITIEQLSFENIIDLLKKLEHKRKNYKTLSNRYRNCSQEILVEILSLL